MLFDRIKINLTLSINSSRKVGNILSQNLTLMKLKIFVSLDLRHCQLKNFFAEKYFNYWNSQKSISNSGWDEGIHFGGWSRVWFVQNSIWSWQNSFVKLAKLQLLGQAWWWSQWIFLKIFWNFLVAILSWSAVNLQFLG